MVNTFDAKKWRISIANPDEVAQEQIAQLLLKKGLNLKGEKARFAKVAEYDPAWLSQARVG